MLKPDFVGPLGIELAADLIASQDATRKALESAMRMVFSESAAEACEQLAEHPEQIRKAQSQICAPFPSMWVEMPLPDANADVGFLWKGNEESRRGEVVFVFWPCGSETAKYVLADIDLDQENPITVSSHHDRLRSRIDDACPGFTDDLLTKHEMLEAIPACFDLLLAGWALVGTVGMTASVEMDATKINKHRKQKSLYPLLSYVEIRLNIDVERKARSMKATETGHMPLHPVRAHYRLLPTARVVLVRPHWRGNSDYGIRQHHYTVVRAEDDGDSLRPTDAPPMKITPKHRPAAPRGATRRTAAQRNSTQRKSPEPPGSNAGGPLS